MRDPTPPPRVRLARGAAGLGLVVVVGAAWLLRMPMADMAIVSLAAQRGIDAAVDVTRLDFSGLTLRNVALATNGRPEAGADELSVGFNWTWSGPKLASIRVADPTVTLRIDERGVSSGLLDAALKGPKKPSKPPEPLPAIALTVERGVLRVETPLGEARGAFEANGVLTRSFTARATAPTFSLTQGERLLSNVAFDATATTRDGDLHIDLNAAADAIALDGWSVSALRSNGRAVVPAAVVGASGSLRATADALRSGDAEARALRAEIALAPVPGDKWRLQAALDASRLNGDRLSASEPQLTVAATGDPSLASGEWMLRLGAGEAFGVSAKAPQASGSFVMNRSETEPVLSVSGTTELRNAAFAPATRRALLDALPGLDGLPGAGLMRTTKAALNEGLAGFSTAVRANVEWRGGAGRIAVDGPVRVELAGARTLVLDSADTSRPALVLLAPSGAVEGAPRLSIAGPGLPRGELTLSKFSLAEGRIAATGVVDIADWTGGGDRLVLPNARFSLENSGDRGAFVLDGAPTLTAVGPIGLDAAAAPLKLTTRWGDGYQVALGGGCAPLTARGLKAAGHTFRNVSLALCPGADGVVAGARADGARYGGFSVARPALRGVLDGAVPRPAAFAADRLGASMVGAGANGRFEFALTGLAYTLDYEPQRTIALRAARLDGRTIEAPGGSRWSGALVDAVYNDPGAGVAVDAIGAGWTAQTEGGAMTLRIADGVAAIRDVKPPGLVDPEWRPRFNPLLLDDFSGALRDETFSGTGALLLADKRRSLGTLTVAHNLKSGAGSAQMRNDGLVFGDGLDLYEVSELARGTADGVIGTVALAFNARWDESGLATNGAIEPRDVSFNTSSLGPVTGVSGSVAFDDLISVTTPPRQVLTVRRLNPGVVVENGRMEIQLLGPDRIALQSAVWPFAGGRLTLAPQQLVVGAPEFRADLGLEDVDVALFLEQLEFKDLAATGRIEGSFPLVFTKDGGSVVDGRLKATPAGGTISYTGAAGEGFQGMAEVAFDALKSFRYDDLELELDGELDGQLVSAINFKGQNLAPIDSLPIDRAIPIPGLGQVDATGLDFRFAISVRAPFRELVKGYQGTQDARPIVEEALKDTGVDPEPPPPQ